MSEVPEAEEEEEEEVEEREAAAAAEVGGRGLGNRNSLKTRSPSGSVKRQQTTRRELTTIHTESERRWWSCLC